MSKVKKVLLDTLSKIKEDDVGILLSGGNGSASVLFALMELGKNINAYTFHLENHESTDLIKARELTSKYGIKFTPVPLPSNLETVKKETIYLVNEVGCELKTDVECCFAYKHTLPYIKEKILTGGVGDDNYFALTKKAKLYYSHSAEKMDEFREIAHKKYLVQVKFFEKMASEYDVELFFPYLTEEMREIFYGKTDEEVNKPKQKQWILDAFPEKFNQNKFYHADFQKGDSKISDNFIQLLNSDWNKKGYKRTDGIYNSIRRGEITE